jgi:hypothetical protein
MFTRFSPVLALALICPASERFHAEGNLGRWTAAAFPCDSPPQAQPASATKSATKHHAD